MDFLKKLSETAKSTATTIGEKSADLVASGKLKVEILQTENKIKGKKQEIGELVYYAFSQGSEPAQDTITQLCEEIRDLEEVLRKLKDQDSAGKTP